MIPGKSISLMEDLVHDSTHAMWSHTTPSLPSNKPGIVRNWRWTSTMIAPAAFLTDNIVKAANKNGSMDPRMMPDNTYGSVSNMFWARQNLFSTPSPHPYGTFWTNAFIMDKAVNTAEPMANPYLWPPWCYRARPICRCVRERSLQRPETFQRYHQRCPQLDRTRQSRA